MADQGKQRPRGDEWKGDEVADAPPGEAEAAADRAAGRTPVDAGGAAGQREEEEAGPAASPRRAAASRADDRQNQELKRQAAVEEHEADRKAGTGTAPKNN
jgi:hypothetical protein